MNHSCTLSLLAAALLACTGAAAATVTSASSSTSTTSSAAASSSTQPDAQQQRKNVLDAMNAASTWGHPDLFGEFAGMKRYAKGDYKGAMKYFLMAAHYADKPSQLAIGILYVNGLGVEKDLATGCAWLDLAAERKYPRFVTTYDVNCKALSPEQHDRMTAELAKLRPEYADAVAKQRMATTLRLARSSRTGSRVGFDYGTEVHSPSSFGAVATAGSAPRNCGNSVVYAGGMALPTKGCVGNDFWSADRWDPKKYFAARDAQWLGTVTVGAPQQVGSTPADTREGHPQPAAATSSAGH